MVKTRSLDLLIAQRGYGSRRALAERIDMDEGQLSRYFNGKVPGPKVLDRLCSALDCQPGDILEHRKEGGGRGCRLTGA